MSLATGFNILETNFTLKRLKKTQLNLGPINTLNAELNPICYLLALLGAHHFLYVSRIRVNTSATVVGASRLRVNSF